jgi:hypothetical protein
MQKWIMSCHVTTTSTSTCLKAECNASWWQRKANNINDNMEKRLWYIQICESEIVLSYCSSLKKFYQTVIYHLYVEYCDQISWSNDLPWIEPGSNEVITFFSTSRVSQCCIFGAIVIIKDYVITFVVDKLIIHWSNKLPRVFPGRNKHFIWNYIYR